MSRGAFHLAAIPFLNPLQCPIHVLVLMTTITGIGDAALFRQQRIRYCEPVIMPPMALHIDCLGHVTVHALTSRLLDFFGLMSEQIEIRRLAIGIETEHPVVTVSRWVNNRCVCLAAVMATQTKPVAGQNCFCRVWVMTIAADHSFEVHAASQKSGEFVVLLTHLAIRVKSVRSVHCRKT